MSQPTPRQRDHDIQTFPVYLSDTNTPRENTSASKFPRRKNNLSRKSLFTGLLATTGALFVSAILEIAMKTNSGRKSISSWGGGPWPEGSQSFMDGSPKFLFPNQDQLQLTSAFFSLAIVTIAGVVSITALIAGPVEDIYCRRITLLGILAFNSVQSLMIVIYTFSIHFKSSNFDPIYAQSLIPHNYPGWVFQYDKGTFDIQTWACEMERHAGFDNQGVMQRACHLELGIMWLSVATFLLSGTLFGIVILDWRGPKLIMRTWKQRQTNNDSESS